MLRHFVFINDYAAITGGLPKIAIDGAKGLARLGCKVTFIAICGPVDQGLLDAGVDVRCMGQPDIWQEPNRLKALGRGIWNAAAVRFVRHQLASFDPASTMLHCQGYSRALSPAIVRLLATSGFAHVYSMHDYMLACPNGTFFHHRDQAICTRTPLGLACLSTGCDARSALHKGWRIARQVAGRTFGRVPTGLKDLIYTSEMQRAIIAPHLPADTRLHYVPNPISVARGERVRVEQNDLFLFVSRLVPEKGATLFAEAARQAGVRAVFVGDGPDRARVEAANPDALVTGWLAPNEVQHWLSRARCLVFPSLWYDASPLTVPEALAKGVPVVCGGWNAGSQSFIDGRSGFVAHDKDPSTWAALLGRMHTEAERLSQNAYADYWANPVDETRHAELLLEVYRKAAEAQWR